MSAASPLSSGPRSAVAALVGADVLAHVGVLRQAAMLVASGLALSGRSRTGDRPAGRPGDGHGLDFGHDFCNTLGRLRCGLALGLAVGHPSDAGIVRREAGAVRTRRDLAADSIQDLAAWPTEVATVCPRFRARLALRSGSRQSQGSEKPQRGHTREVGLWIFVIFLNGKRWLWRRGNPRVARKVRPVLGLLGCGHRQKPFRFWASASCSSAVLVSIAGWT